MQKLKINIISLFLITIIPVFNIFADGLEGNIKDHGSQLPISGVVIWLEGTDFIDTTDNNGHYQIVGVPVGNYNVIIDHQNYSQKVFPNFLIDGTVDIQSKFNSTPQDFYLGQNYPNPFNPSTRISFQLPHSEHVKLKVYDFLGNFVADLVDEWKSAGFYNITWNGKDQKGSLLPSGVYFYQITAGRYSISKKMILMK